MPCQVVRREALEESLKQPPRADGGLVTQFSNFPLKVLEDVAQWRDAEVHAREGDLWVCLEGEARFVYGGKLVDAQCRQRVDGTDNPDELYAASITGGTEVFLKPGDYLWVPAGEPHQHGAATVARLGIIKIPQ